MSMPSLRLALVTATLILTSPASAAAAPEPRSQTPPPRLAVVIVIDQLRTDYLARFREHFVDGGFNRFLVEGASFPAARYEHAVTQTCAGHAVVLTGAHANVNGIVANNWYERETEREVYCALDEDAPLIGVEGAARSPRRLRAATVGDELRRMTGGRSRVVSIAGKDRSAIMMGGHSSSDVYWIEDGRITTSTFYRSELPWRAPFPRQRDRSGNYQSRLALELRHARSGHVDWCRHPARALFISGRPSRTLRRRSRRCCRSHRPRHHPAVC